MADFLVGGSCMQPSPDGRTRADDRDGPDSASGSRLSLQRVAGSEIAKRSSTPVPQGTPSTP